MERCGSTLIFINEVGVKQPMSSHFNMLNMLTMVMTLNFVGETLPIIDELGDRATEFTPAETSVAIGGVNNPVVYALFLFSV